MLEALFGAICTVAIGLVGWGVRLESRTNVSEQRHDDLKELIETKFEVVVAKLDAFDRRLERVERHVLNGSYGRDI